MAGKKMQTCLVALQLFFVLSLISLGYAEIGHKNTRITATNDSNIVDETTQDKED